MKNQLVPMDVDVEATKDKQTDAEENEEYLTVECCPDVDAEPVDLVEIPADSDAAEVQEEEVGMELISGAM